MGMRRGRPDHHPEETDRFMQFVDRYIDLVS